MPRAFLFNIRTFAMYALIAFSTSAFAGPTNWYRVEVIVFENPTKGAYSEGWASKSYFQVEGNASGPKDTLPKQSWSLGGVESKLRAKQHKILIHTAWRQAVADKKNALPIRIQGGPAMTTPEGRSETELDGTLTISLSRYLHVATDLQLLKSIQSNVKGFRMTESRRMKSNEVHYIDHPMFGMIIKIMPE